MALEKYEDSDVVLDDTHHDEMSQIVEELERDDKQQNAIFKEAVTYGVEDSLQEICLADGYACMGLCY